MFTSTCLNNSIQYKTQVKINLNWSNQISDGLINLIWINSIQSIWFDSDGNRHKFYSLYKLLIYTDFLKGVIKIIRKVNLSHCINFRENFVKFQEFNEFDNLSLPKSHFNDLMKLIILFLYFNHRIYIILDFEISN